MINATIFEVGLQVTIEKELDKQDIKYKSHIVGWKNDSYMLFELPFVNGDYSQWKSGTSIIVKFINRGRVYMFRSTLIKSTHQPVPLIFSKFPVKVEDGTTRKHERIQTYLISDLYPLTEELEQKKFDFIDEENFIGNAVLLDFSRGGGLIEIRNNLTNFSINEKIGMNVTLPSGVYIDKLIVEIRNIRIEAGKKLAGIKFLKLNPDALKEITDFFEKYNTL